MLKIASSDHIKYHEVTVTELCCSLDTSSYFVMLGVNRGMILPCISGMS